MARGRACEHPYWLKTLLHGLRNSQLSIELKSVSCYIICQSGKRTNGKIAVVDTSSQRELIWFKTGKDATGNKKAVDYIVEAMGQVVTEACDKCNKNGPNDLKHCVVREGHVHGALERSGYNVEEVCRGFRC